MCQIDDLCTSPQIIKRGAAVNNNEFSIRDIELKLKLNKLKVLTDSYIIEIAFLRHHVITRSFWSITRKAARGRARYGRF
jgi:hypothetical protein